MRVIELFAGIGGFRVGLERAGHKIVYTSEWLEKPRSIYRKHWPEDVESKDVRLIRGSELPEAELICGGFPCATFSAAGRRKGFSSEDARGTLFFEMARLARERQVPYIFFENVKGLLCHDGGRTFAVILTTLDEFGYDCQWECVNSKNLGVPQGRERVFLIGNLRTVPRPAVFPLTATDSCIPQSDWQKSQNGSGTCDGIKRSGPTAPLGVLDERGRKRDKAFIHMRAYGGIFQRERQSDHIWTMTTSPQNTFAVSLDGEALRQLSPIECERLQGLPDDFTKYYHDGTEVPSIERYERVGRTVTAQVIEAIGHRLARVNYKLGDANG